MSKFLVSFSILFLGICMVISSWIISQSLNSKKDDVVKIQGENNRYEFIKMADDYNVIFDKQTGEYWGSVQGRWEKQSSISN